MIRTNLFFTSSLFISHSFARISPLISELSDHFKYSLIMCEKKHSDCAICQAFYWTFFRTLNQLELAKPWVFQKFHEFISKILEFSENLLQFSEKSSFGAIFLEKFTKTEQIKKKFGFQLTNYWVFNKLAWVFGRKLLEFFRDPPWVIFEMSKKSLG